MLRRALPFFVFILCWAGIASASRAADAEILRVWPGWRDAESFERISEYFGGGENPGRQIILRTHPDTRAGFYFLVRIKAAAPLGAAKLILTVVRPDTPEPKSYTFAADVPKKETVFLLGLTGGDWPTGPLANPVAWKIAVSDAEGRVQAEEKSFLWEKP